MPSRGRGKRICRIFVFCVLALAVSLDARAVFACTPAPPTPWFDTRLRMISQNVPAGVLFAETDYGSLTLQNNTTSTIKIPVMQNEAHNSGYEEILVGKAAHIAWSGASFGETVSSTESLYINSGLVDTFQSRNVIQDNRPAHPKIPEARVIPLHMLIGDQPVDAQLSVDYTLNPYYRSDSVYMFENGCINWYNQMMWDEFARVGGFVLLCLIVLLLVVSAAFYLHVQLGRNQRQKKS